MEMDPTPGYSFASWDTGYGDLRALPDLATLREAAWLDRSALVLCDAVAEEGDEPVSVAPRTSGPPLLRASAIAAASAAHCAPCNSDTRPPRR